MMFVAFDSACVTFTTFNQYEQCGGEIAKHMFSPVDGPFACTKCSTGYHCVRDSAYYYQCLPNGKATTT